MDAYVRRLNPVHLVVLVSAMPLLLGALLADLAYGRTYEVQWSNFAAWLLVGAQVFLTATLVFAVFDFVRARRLRGDNGLYLLAIAITWLLGFINNLVHAMDAWQKMPTAAILSLVATLMIGVAMVLALRGTRDGRAQP